MKMDYFKNVDTRLLPMKAIMFGWFGAHACASPFFTIHMKALGLTAQDTAIVYIMLPITQFLTSPIAGFIVDRLGKFRNILLVSAIMTFAMATALLYVPPINSFMDENPAIISFNCTNQQITDSRCESATHIYLISDSCSVACTDSFARGFAMNISATAFTSHFCSSNHPLLNLSSDSFPSVCSSVSHNTMLNCKVVCLDIQPVLSTKVERSNWLVTFWLYSAFLVVYNIFSAIGFTMVNAAGIILTETKDKGGEYGRVRLWALVGMSVFPPLAGLAVEAMSTDTHHMNYSPAFYCHNLLALFTGFSVWHLDIEIERPTCGYRETFQNIKQILKSPPIFMLLIVTFWLGTMWGFFEAFVFWFLKELNSPTYMLGLTITVGSAAGIPFLYYAKDIVKMVGHANILAIGVLMYMVRSVGCSFLINPWWVMPYEVLEIFTYHLMWYAAATHGARLSPPGLLATVQGFIEAVHYGAGLGAGSLIGGEIIHYWGTRQAFQVMGVISGGVAVVYTVLNFTWLRRYELSQSKQQMEQEKVIEKYERKPDISFIDINCTFPPEPEPAHESV